MGYFSSLRNSHPYKIGDYINGLRVIATFYRRENGEDVAYVTLETRLTMLAPDKGQAAVAQHCEEVKMNCKNCGSPMYHPSPYELCPKCEGEILDKWIAEQEAAQPRVQRTDCPVCRGRGFNVDWNKNNVKCSTCNGTGISR